MKILFLVNELSIVNGITKHLQHLISGLIEQKKYKCFLICGYAEKEAISKFNKLGVKVEINQNLFHQNRSYFRFLLAIAQLSLYSKKNRITIIHTHHFYSANIAEKSLFFSHAKTIQTNHGIIPEIGYLSHFPSGNIITVNNHAYDYVKSKTKNKNIFFIRNGIEEEKCTCVKKKNIKVLVASRLVMEKGIDIFIKAVSLLSEMIKENVSFYIIGKGDYKNELLSLNKRLKTNILFRPMVTNLQKLLCETNIFVNPTRSSSEGFPTAIIEAGLQKNLIISSNFWGSENVLINKENSLIFDNDDELSLKEQLSFGIINYYKCNNIIENFYLLCKKLYSQDEMVKQISLLYEKISEK